MFPIDQIGEDTVSLNSGKVRMKTSKEFFGFNKKNFIYEGEVSPEMLYTATENKIATL